ncbi:hypothetical protein IJJ39_00535 [Candidatus Saccharibacteria bacterium]|nr:hypothetical protein [Candidatus Saccharibacteria bacterium]
MKNFWDDFWERWAQMSAQEHLVLMSRITLMVFLFGGLITTLTYTPPTSEPTKQEPTESIEETVKFAAESFKVDVLTTFYQAGKWDGETVKSYDGNHISSINRRGYLVIDGKTTAYMPDLPKDCAPYGYRAFYHDDSGTYLSTWNAGVTSPDDDNFYLFHKGEKLRTYPVPFTEKASDLSFNAAILDHVVIMTSLKDHSTVRFDPRQTDTKKFDILSTDIGGSSLIQKISGDKVRFINSSSNGTNELYEVGETGDIKLIASSENAIRIRAIEDYPETGDQAEFWLPRIAYTSGKWDGTAISFGNLAKLVGKNLSEKPKSYPKNRRAPQLDELDCSNIDASTVVSVGEGSYLDHGRRYIMVDNMPKYYLHAVRPFLVDDIKYRKIFSLNSAFVELVYGNYDDYVNADGASLYVGPSCYFTSAGQSGESSNDETCDYSSSIVSLPFYGQRDYSELTPELCSNLEIIDCVNSENSMRAVAIGFYDDSDVNNPEASFSLFLSRKNSNFEHIAGQLLSAHFFSEFATDYLGHENYYVPAFARLGIWLDGKNSDYFTNDIFRFNNTLEPYVPKKEPSMESTD